MLETAENMQALYEATFKDIKPGAVVKGKVLKVDSNYALIDIGYKSEGLVPLEEFREKVEPGDEVDVMVLELEDKEGMVVLSKEKADRLKKWQDVVFAYHKEELVKGRVTRKVKGGYTVDIGVDAFLPSSQAGRDERDLQAGKLEFKVLKINEARKNVVVSHKAVAEEERAQQRTEIFATLVKGETRSGRVKNIVDFGVFIDLGGADGLLHITDMSWGKISHPSELLKVGDDVDVVILGFDAEASKISLGIKQKTENPWLQISDKYDVSSRHTGKVVNITDYGAFVELEEGVEGLVHISEMSWVKKLSHPSETVAIGDVVEVEVLSFDAENQKISLGMKQLEPNPWNNLMEKYPPETKVKGKIRNITDYGAFLELEPGIDGLIHISDMSWASIKHPSEILKKGDKVEAVVLEIDSGAKRVSLGIKQLTENPWEQVEGKYNLGDVMGGKVTKVVPFGAFVELEPGIEGLVHISRMGKENEIAEGDSLQVKVVNVKPEERKIGLALAEDGTPED